MTLDLFRVPLSVDLMTSLGRSPPPNLQKLSLQPCQGQPGLVRTQDSGCPSPADFPAYATQVQWQATLKMS